jgi:hypothetical protein
MDEFFYIKISNKLHASQFLQILNESFPDLEITEAEKNI